MADLRTRRLPVCGAQGSAAHGIREPPLGPAERRPAGAADPARRPDFTTVAAKVIDIQAGGWKDAGKLRRHQPKSSLAAYAFPVLGAIRLDAIAGTDVLAVVLKSPNSGVRQIGSPEQARWPSHPRR